MNFWAEPTGENKKLFCYSLTVDLPVAGPAIGSHLVNQTDPQGDQNGPVTQQTPAKPQNKFTVSTTKYTVATEPNTVSNTMAIELAYSLRKT